MFSINVYSITGVAGSPLPFLRAGVGARALSLSGAFSSFYDDSTVSYWNPSGISYINKISISSMFSWMTADRKYNFFNFLIPVENFNLALNFINFSIDNIEGRESDTEEFFTFSDVENAYFLTISKELIKTLKNSFSSGANLKLIQTSLYKYNSFGFSCDLGVLLKFDDNISVGVSFQDIFGRVKWSTGKEEIIPVILRIGSMISFFNEGLKTSIEFENIQNEGIVLKSGMEIKLINILFLRGGISYNEKSYEFNWSAGGGIKYKVYDFIFQIDYAFVPENIFQNMELQHKLSINIYF